jgi:transposase
LFNEHKHPTWRPAIQLKVKTILNRIQRFPGFVYQAIDLYGHDDWMRIEIDVRAHAHHPGLCARCLRPAPGYDHLPPRVWQFVPLWNIPTLFCYAPRRVHCPQHGIGVEHLPWSAGKRPLTTALMIFLAQWARRLSWRETAQVFRTSWEAVYRSVDWFVGWGLAHRVLTGVQAIGIDEIHWGRGKGAATFLTVIYQIDRHCRRLLWVGPRRTQATLRRGLAALGPPVVAGLRFVCSDMWKPYLQVIAAHVGHALHILDRFHITAQLNQAVDEVRRSEDRQLRDRQRPPKLKHLRWKLLRRGNRVRGRAKNKLQSLLRSKLATGRAWMLKESFYDFWRYRSVTWATAFLSVWCERALRSRIEPMRKVARMLRAHEDLILNWFRAKGEVSTGTVEGLNNKIRVVTRRSYGFRTYHAMELALYHNLGRLPEPPLTHRFC